MTPQVKGRTIVALLTVTSMLLAGCGGNLEPNVDEDVRDIIRGMNACSKLKNEVKRARGSRVGKRHWDRCLNEVVGLRPQAR